MRLTDVPSDHYVRAHNKPAAHHLERFLGGDRSSLPQDLQLVHDQEREALLSTMLQRFDADPSTGRDAPWNPPTKFYPKSNNTWSNRTVLFGSELESLRRRWVRSLHTLKIKLGGKRPLVLLDYYGDGCFTTRMLRSLLAGFCGDDYDDLVLELRPSFDIRDIDRKKNPHAPIAGDPEAFVHRVKLATSQGGIIIAGGSFKSAYDQHGQFFRNKIMPLFLENPFNRGLMICWAYHVLMQAIADFYSMDVAVLNGGLRWGTLPVTILNRGGPLTGVFNDSAVDRISPQSAVFTSTDHVVFGHRIGLGGKIIGSESGQPWKKRHLRVIASDAISDQPCGVMLDDERFFGLAFHGEVLRGPDIEEIQHTVRQGALATALERDYNVPSDAVAANFDPGLPRSRQPRMEQDLGPALYLGILDRLTRSLLKDLRVRGSR